MKILTTQYSLPVACLFLTIVALHTACWSLALMLIQVRSLWQLVLHISRIVRSNPRDLQQKYHGVPNKIVIITFRPQCGTWNYLLLKYRSWGYGWYVPAENMLSVGDRRKGSDAYWYPRRMLGRQLDERHLLSSLWNSGPLSLIHSKKSFSQTHQCLSELVPAFAASSNAPKHVVLSHVQ